jgi:hypothetical protein
MDTCPIPIKLIPLLCRTSSNLFTTSMRSTRRLTISNLIEEDEKPPCGIFSTRGFSKINAKFIAKIKNKKNT